MRHKVSQSQMDLLEKSKAFLRERDARSSCHSATDPENYLSVWASGSLGRLRIQCLRQARWMSRDIIVAYIKNIVSLGYQADLFLDRVDNHLEYERIVISWCTKSNFLLDGSVRSPYFNCTTKSLDSALWVMLPLDGAVPENKQKNVVFFNRKRTGIFSLVFFLKNLFFCLRRGVSASAEGLFAQKLADEIVLKTDIQGVQSLLMPYEGQPWQHTLSLQLKRRNKNIHVLGDLHSCLPPLPTDFIKRCGAPDIVFMHGRGQKNIMLESLGWSDSDIKVLPSLRLAKDNSVDLRNKILLPYNFNDVDIILENLDLFYKKFERIIPELDIRNHPVQLSSPSHLALIKGILELQEKYKISPKARLSDAGIVLVIGASSAIIECLQRNMKVFQIAEDLIFESYGPEIWKDLDVTYLNENVAEYSLQGNPAYLEFGASDIQMMFENA